MPAIPGDAIQVLVVLPKAIEDSVEVGVRAAVVPVSAWCKKQISASGLSVPSPWTWLIGETTGVRLVVFLVVAKQSEPI